MEILLSLVLLFPLLSNPFVSNKLGISHWFSNAKEVSRSEKEFNYNAYLGQLTFNRELLRLCLEKKDDLNFEEVMIQSNSLFDAWIKKVKENNLIIDYDEVKNVEDYTNNYLDGLDYEKNN